ncbi:hypothetical protein AAVH_30184 [Aphelenchoides avenae]|nr:hypothetical protein AAVH_30184 [Aphelenchus avenae]
MLSVLANSDIVIVELYHMPLVRGSDAWCFRVIASAALLAPFRVDIRLLQPQSEDSPFPYVHARPVHGLPDEIR